jgi:hypothetical protein
MVAERGTRLDVHDVRTRSVMAKRVVSNGELADGRERSAVSASPSLPSRQDLALRGFADVRPQRDALPESVEPSPAPEDPGAALPDDATSPGAADQEPSADGRREPGSPHGRRLTASARPLPIDSLTNVATGPPASVVAPRTPGLPGLERLAHVDLAGAIAARSRALPAEGSVELRFALEPEDLGPVRVQILSRGERIEVRILAATGAAVDAIGTGLSRLTSQLVEAGFRDPSIELALDDAGGSGGRHETADGGERPPRDRRSATARAATDCLVPTAGRAPAGRLDRTA